MTKFGKSISFLVFILLIGVGIFVFNSRGSVVKKPIVTNFTECINAGYLVMESYPRQCRDDKGQLFVEVIENPVIEVPTEEKVEETNEKPTEDISEYKKEILFKINDTKTFSDGFTVKLKEINDSRCKEGVQCIWAGELAGTFLVSGGVFSPSVEIILGNTNNKSVTLKGYTFTLQKATEDSITIIIQKI